MKIKFRKCNPYNEKIIKSSLRFLREGVASTHPVRSALLVSEYIPKILINNNNFSFDSCYLRNKFPKDVKENFKIVIGVHV